MKKDLISKGILFSVILAGILFFMNSSYALPNIESNESIQAKKLLVQAEKDIFEMMEKNIPVNRVNETYHEALQIYLAQLALEEKWGKANYKLVNDYVEDIGLIKKAALEAKDNLQIFLEIFEEAERDANLSEMDDDYKQIIDSYYDERFEDTIKLINKGYDRISEVQASQTIIKSFYLTTSKTVRSFFLKNKLKIVVILVATLLFIALFWNSLKRLKMQANLNHLMIQRKALGNLIQELQKNYFKIKKMSETEYNVKLEKFKELIRDVDRQTMVLKEDVFKIGKKGKRFFVFGRDVKK